MASDPLFGEKPILQRFSLEGRTALVTGGARGIGRAFCHALAEAGARTAVVDIDLDEAEKVCAELSRKDCPESFALQADVTDKDSVFAMVKKIADRWGTLTIGVNNAGIGFWVDSEKSTEEEWRRVMSVNLDGVFYCCQAEASLMLDTGYGKIINTASMSGHIANRPQKQAAYNSSKAAVLHLTRSLAAEWAVSGIRVNSISPGYTYTELVEKLVASPEGKKMMGEWLEMIPMKKMGQVTDLQGAIVYLASEVSDMMTGHDMIIDGGYCTW
jgi:NAD(P)-dependent dehydrogenase (short-subunit alcohol dehydrogenase family)